MRGLAQVISSNACVDLIPNRATWGLASSDRLSSADNRISSRQWWLRERCHCRKLSQAGFLHANQHESWPQLLQCQNGPTSPIIKLQRCTYKLIPYAIYTSQFYPVSGGNDYTPCDLSTAHACAAWILRSLLHYRKQHLNKQSPQIRLGTKLQCTKDRNSSVPARQCPEFNNTNRVDGHTPIGAPASSLSNCCFDSAS